MPEQTLLLDSAQTNCKYIAEWSSSVTSQRLIEANPETTKSLIAQVIFPGSTAKLLGRVDKLFGYYKFNFARVLPGRKPSIS